MLITDSKSPALHATSNLQYYPMRTESRSTPLLLRIDKPLTLFGGIAIWSGIRQCQNFASFDYFERPVLLFFHKRRTQVIFNELKTTLL